MQPERLIHFKLPTLLFTRAGKTNTPLSSIDLANARFCSSSHGNHFVILVVDSVRIESDLKNRGVLVHLKSLKM